MVPLSPGDLVLFYTDALTEAADVGGHQLGEAGLLGLVQQFDSSEPARIPTSLIEALSEFRGGRAATDDTSFILLHHNAGPTRMPGFVETLNIYAKVLGLKSV